MKIEAVLIDILTSVISTLTITALYNSSCDEKLQSIDAGVFKRISQLHLFLRKYIAN